MLIRCHILRFRDVDLVSDASFGHAVLLSWIC